MEPLFIPRNASAFYVRDLRCSIIAVSPAAVLRRCHPVFGQPCTIGGFNFLYPPRCLQRMIRRDTGKRWRVS
jgi:hypothetical protein